MQEIYQTNGVRGFFNVVGLIEAVSGDQVGGEGGAADAGAWTVHVFRDLG